MTLRVSPRFDPLLRRPLAFAGFDDADSFASAIYQVRGSATLILSELAPGSRIDVIAPLGKPFPLPATGETALLAAGGVGIGPILFLARELAAGAQGATPCGSLDAAQGASSPATRLILGFRSASSIPGLALPPGAILCTEDGSAGFEGTPVDWMSRNAPAGSVRLYACGPGAMLAALARLAEERSWASSFSAEQWMACGLGACMGCVLPRADGLGYLRACSEGPVFDGAVIDWAGTGGDRGGPPGRGGSP